MDVSQTITDILNYYNANPNCDPNMYKFIGLCNDVAKYLIKAAPNYGIHQNTEFYPIPAAVFEKFEILMRETEKKLLENDLDITEKSPLYDLFAEATCDVSTYKTRYDIELRQLVGDAALCIAQGKRDVRKGIRTEFHYENIAEFDRIKKLEKLYSKNYEESSSIKILINEITASYEQTDKVR